MKQKRWWYVVWILSCWLMACTQTASPPDPQPAVQSDSPAPDLSTAERVTALLGQMTLAEKIGQMTLVEKNSITPNQVATHHIGALLSGGGGYPQPNTPEQWRAMITEFQASATQTRLGIPLLYGVDAVHGHNNLYGATIFPHNIGLGATRNPQLVAEIAQVTALETAATGVNWNFAPVLAVARDIRWGRTYESYSEDTQLVTELSTAYLRGLQGDDLAAPTTLLATPKHFVGDGGTTWGSSHGGYQIDQGDTQLDETRLRDTHLAPYVEAIEAGAQSIMVSFSRWNDEYMHGQRYLLTDVLKEELGFTGFLVSDWQAIDQIDSDYYRAVVQAINAGIDMNMVPYDYETFIHTMHTAVDNGDIPLERIDDAVRRILTAKFALGLFENPVPSGENVATIGREAHRELARRAVQESLVLLKNEAAVLPLDKETPLIFVAGVAARDIGQQAGGWTIEWQGGTGRITEGTTILAGLEAAVSAEAQLHYNRHGNFEHLTDEAGQSAMADVGIVVVGEQPYAEGRGDSADVALSQADVALVERVREQSQRLVIILIGGRPLIITDILDTADALVMAWLPGSEGQGVADVLFGDVPFTGKLPFTWPTSADYLPLELPEPPSEAVLFPFGYGLDD